MTYDEPDDLDRAIFALPLATPPDGFRTALFAATVDAAQRVTVPFAPVWEIWAGGIALAVAAWLCLALVAYKGFALALSAQIDAAVLVLTAPGTLAWLAMACLFTAALWYAGDRTPRLPFRGARP